MINKLFRFIIRHKQFLKYLIVGAITTLVSFFTYYLFSRVCGLNYKVSTVLSWIFAVLFAFITNKTIVFKSKVDTKIGCICEMIKFFQYRLLSLLLDILFMYMMIEGLRTNDLIAKCIVQVVIIVANYVFSKFFVFSHKKTCFF